MVAEMQLERDKLFARYAASVRPRLMRRAMAFGSREDAEDIVQVALLEAWRRRHQFDVRSGSNGFLMWLSRYIALIGMSMRSRRLRQSRRLVSSEDVDLSVVAVPLGIDDNEAVRSAITDIGLTEKQMHCALLWLDGLKQAEIGALLGIRQESVRDHLKRVKSKLKSRGDVARRHWFDEVSARDLYHGRQD